MLLRSSSTPILGSLLASESPSHGNHSEFNSPKHLSKKFSVQQSPLNIIPSSFSNSSPFINGELICDGSCSSQTNGNLRRAQSAGNLEGLVSAACNSFDEFNNSIPAKKFPRKPRPVLQSIPSFSISNSKRPYEEDGEGDEEEEEEKQEESGEILSLEKTMALMSNMGLQERYINVQEESKIPSKMHLARGFGVLTGGGGYDNGGVDNGGGGFGSGGDDWVNMAEYYKKMVEDNPGNPLLLRNYAEFLHKTKKDLGGAEEYYSRAILMDPGDGEILSQYAQLIWELDGDEERALSYFQRAVQASPENSHVQAAYANFLWDEVEEEEVLSTIPHYQHTTTAVKTKVFV